MMVPNFLAHDFWDLMFFLAELVYRGTPLVYFSLALTILHSAFHLSWHLPGWRRFYRPVAEAAENAPSELPGNALTRLWLCPNYAASLVCWHYYRQLECHALEPVASDRVARYGDECAYYLARLRSAALFALVWGILAGVAVLWLVFSHLGRP
jgi:hypothetical protein